MSEQVYLVLGVVGTFVAVLLGSARLFLSAQGRRSSRVLQAQLEGAGISVAARAHRAPFSDRVVEPFLSELARVARRITPAGMRESAARKLLLAGMAESFPAEVFVLLQLVAVVLGAVAGKFVGTGDDPRVLGVFWVPMLAFICYLLPTIWLDGKVTARQGRMRRDLADAIDLLTISVEAGLAFDAALLQVRRSMRGPLSEEIGRMLHEIQLGMRRVDAFRELADRTSVEELRGFVLAMVQADVFGVSIANVLRAQSEELRTKRRQRAEEQAMKAPVKLLFPMIACILPALLVVIVGPGIIRIAHALGGTGVGGLGP